MEWVDLRNLKNSKLLDRKKSFFSVFFCLGGVPMVARRSVGKGSAERNLNNRQFWGGGEGAFFCWRGGVFLLGRGRFFLGEGAIILTFVFPKNG